MWFDFILFRGKGIEWLIHGGVLLSMTLTHPRGRTEHVATFAVSATDPAAALYFIDVFLSSVYSIS